MTDATNDGIWAASKLLIAVMAVVAVIAGSTLLSGVVSAAATPHSAPRPAMSQQDAILAAAASQAGTPYCGSGGGISGPSKGGGCAAKGFNCMSFAQYAVYQ